METKLSIIIPYYKTLELTKKLLDKLVPQLTKECECIVIDDGCNELELDKYPITVIHKENGGVSKARNTGLDKAKGKYIVFIDSDDMIKDNYIKTILDKIATTKFDYCMFSWEAVGRLKGQYIIKDTAPSWNTCVWNCIYKREIIGRFDVTKTIAEDEDFNNKYRNGIKANIEDILYIYNSGRENSLTDLCSRGIIDKNSIQCSLLLYQKSISEIGGVEKFITEFCKEFKDTYDITLVYSTCDRKQLYNLQKMVRCIRYENQKFECDKYLCVSNQLNIADNVKSRDNFYADMIHADLTAMNWRYNKHPKTNVHIAVSEIAKQSFLRQIPNEKCEVIYNLLKVNKPKKVLRIISAMRLGLNNIDVDKEKGHDIMEIMAEKIISKSPMIWNIFTDHPKMPKNGICYSNSQLDIDSYIADAHFYVSGSPAESWGYSTAQALELGIPVVCMDYPAIHEQGLIDGVNGYIIKRDLSNLDDIIDKMINGKLNLPKYIKKDNPKQWIDLLGNIQKKSDYKYIKPDGFEVEVLKGTYYSIEDKHAKEGDIIVIKDKTRLDDLVNRGYVKLI